MPNVKQPFYIPSLDGIRTIAFLAVFLSHAGFGHIIPGRFGVTIFFFLSGYLITTLMRIEFAKTGAIGFKQFYVRRLLRIFPPLYITLAIAFCLCSFNLIGGEPTAISSLLQIAQLTNYQIIYFGANYIPSGTEVLWSLAVEEHFYLGFPVLYYWIATRGFARNKQALILLALCLLPLAWRIVLVRSFGATDHRTGFGTDTRIDSILLGSVMALCHNPVLDPQRLKSTRARTIALFAGLALLAFTFLYRDDRFRMDIRYTLQGVAMFPIFYVAIVAHEAPIIRWLNFRWVRWLGVTSYSSYLLHAVILDFVGGITRQDVWLTACLSLALTVGASALMYQIVEQPCARLRRRLHN